MQQESAHVGRTGSRLEVAIPEPSVRYERFIRCLDVRNASVPKVVSGGMSDRVDQRPTLTLWVAVASRPEQRFFNDKVTSGISLNLPHHYVSFRDGLGNAIEALKLRLNVAEYLFDRARRALRGAGIPSQQHDGHRVRDCAHRYRVR
jgi:hypothetical protein